VTNITDHYEKVLEFICKLEDVDDLAHLFEYLDNFWQTQFGTAPVLIYSRNKKRKSQLRDYWNKGKEKIYYDKKELSLFSSLVLASKDDDGFSFQKEGDDLTMYLIVVNLRDRISLFVLKSLKRLQLILLIILFNF